MDCLKEVPCLTPAVILLMIVTLNMNDRTGAGGKGSLRMRSGSLGAVCRKQ